MSANANLIPNIRQKFFDAAGLPLASGKLYSYAAGTTTPQATYTDGTGATPNTNPIILDANGEADIWLGPLSYKFVLKDSADVTLKTVDNVILVADGSIGTIKLTDLSVTTAKLASGAVTTTKIGTGEVKAANIGTGEVTTTKLNDSAVTTVKIADANVTAAKLATDIYSGVFTERNKIINGDMYFAQRGTSFAPAVSTNYTLDRWKYFKSGAAAFTVAADSDVPTFAQSGYTFTGSMKLTCTTADTSIAAGDIVEIGQPIEGYFCRDIILKPVVLSFWIKSTKAAVMGVTLKNGITGNVINTPTRSIIKEFTISAVSTWQKIEIPVIAPTSGTWNSTFGVCGLYVGFVLSAGSTYQTTKDVWQNGDYSGTSAMANFSDATSNIINITGVRLEGGTIARQYESRHPAIEDALCRRYYEIIPFDFRQYNTNVVSASAIGGKIGYNVAKPTNRTVSSTSVVTTKCNNAFVSDGIDGVLCLADLTNVGAGAAIFSGKAIVESDITT